MTGSPVFGGKTLLFVSSGCLKEQTPPLKGCKIYSWQGEPAALIKL